MFGFVELVYDDEVSSQNLKALRAADRGSIPSDRGFASWDAFGAWAKAYAARRAK